MNCALIIKKENPAQLKLRKESWRKTGTRRDGVIWKNHLIGGILNVQLCHYTLKTKLLKMKNAEESLPIL